MGIKQKNTLNRCIINILFLLYSNPLSPYALYIYTGDFKKTYLLIKNLGFTLYLLSMKYLIKKIITEVSALDKVTDVLFDHGDYEEDEVQDILKLFGKDMSSIYHMIDQKGGRGLEFLNHLQNNVHHGGAYLIEVLQIGDPVYSKEDMDLFMTWIFPMWESTEKELKRRGDRILLEIADNEENELFEKQHQDLAEIMFDEDAMPMDSDFNALRAEDLLGYMTEKNFIGLVRYVGKHNMNEEIDTFREEFEPWIESDNLGDFGTGRFLLTPFRLNSFLEPERDLEDRKYNFLVLLTSSDKLSDILNEVEWVYSDSYNHAWENDYRKSFYTALEGLIGSPIGTGEITNYNHTKQSPTNIYDVTDLLSTILWRDSKNGEDPGKSSMFELIEYHKGLLTPDEVYYPDEDDEEIIADYNEYLGDLFGDKEIY